MFAYKWLGRREDEWMDDWLCECGAELGSGTLNKLFV